MQKWAVPAALAAVLGNLSCNFLIKFRSGTPFCSMSNLKNPRQKYVFCTSAQFSEAPVLIKQLRLEVKVDFNDRN